MKTTDEKIEDALAKADEDCEGANYHGMVGLSGSIWRSIKKFLPEDKKLAAAKALSKAITDSL